MATEDKPKPPPLPPRQPLRPLTHSQRCAIFGTFSYRATPTATAPEKIEINTSWLAANIVVVPLPHLSHMNGGTPVKARVHRLVAPKLLALFDAWRAARLTLLIRTWNGSHVSRFKRGHAGGGPMDLSNHAWGTAFDVNAQWNRLGQKPAVQGAPGSLVQLVPIANEQGWAWGGDFSNPDGMHWELVRP